MAQVSKTAVSQYHCFEKLQHANKSLKTDFDHSPEPN
jgi:hypothetical protein